MAVLLGIDTGGTYTDAVLFDENRGVVASAKALTTKYDLALGIRSALDGVLSKNHPEIGLVSLSTTLATNAIVEGQGSPICLILLGYPPDALGLAGLGQALGDDPVVFLPGGHRVDGSEQMPLDLEAARQAILEHAPRVAAFAVSGYFGVLNPQHELAVRDLARQKTGLPVTCGHELTSDLHAPRRALTVALNARLIPLLQQLILAVKGILEEKGIRAPLMVVKGDGSLMEFRMALERPVETILSGPAASLVGAHHLSGEEDVLVVDMGGTTTDIALLENGRPALSGEGAAVGGWQTMVEAIAVHTSGLGGDSEVRWDESQGLVIGPQRLVPLSLLTDQHPAVLDVLRLQVSRGEPPRPYDAWLALRQRSLDAGEDSLDPDQLEMWNMLEGGPLPLQQIYADPLQALWLRRLLERLVERGLVVLSGFTPTDAAHVLGYQQAWSTEAAGLGAQLWARRIARYLGDNLTEQAFCQRVFQQVTVQLGRAAVAAVLDGKDGLELDRLGPWREFFVDRALGKEAQGKSLVEVDLTLRRPLVAVGAPVATYFPTVADRLHTRLAIPDHAEVASAVGAVVGSVAQSVRALIRPLPDFQGYRLYLPTGVQDFSELEDAAAYATQVVERLAKEQARRAGAARVQVSLDRQDHIFHPENAPDIFLETEIKALAVGRPRFS